MKLTPRFSIYIFLLLTVWSCNEKESGPDTNADRKALLENAGNHIILPAYQNLVTATNNLQEKTQLFTANPTAETLAPLQQAWKEAALRWQTCETFEFGPAESKDLRMQVNAFPTSSTKIESTIASGNAFTPAYMTSLDAFAKGFPALDYLLFSLTSDQNEVISRFTSDASAAKRKEFLLANTVFIKDEVSAVTNEWMPNGGNYLGTFTSNTGTDVGSSIGYLINQMNYHLEIVINQKMGVPLGKRSNGTIYPQRVEGYYSQNSLTFIKENLTQLQNLFEGKGTNGNGAGLAEYLDALQAKDSQEILLSQSIMAKMNAAIKAVNDIPLTLPEAINSDKMPVDKAYNELKSVLIPFKVDMPSAIGTSITYIDNDGD